MSLAAVALVLLCVFCYTGQNFFNKMYSITYTGPAVAATPVFASIYGLLTGAATLAYNGFQFQADAATVGLGIANGVVLFLFNLGAINASRSGPYAFQSIMLLFGNILLPLLFSVLWWGDGLSLLQIIGIAVMLASFVLFNLGGLNFEGRKKGYFLWVTVLFFTNGAYGILIDAQQRVARQTQRNEMIIVTFVVSAVISLVYLAVVQRSGVPKAFRMGKKPWLYALGSSVCAAVAINILMLALRLIPASILYTVENGGILIMCALLSAVVLREKLTKNMIAGIGAAVISLLLLSV